MIPLLKRIVSKNQELIFSEARQMEGFLRLLFKPRNTAQKWTQEEKKKIRDYLKRSSLYMPVTMIFLLPGSLLLLPFLALILDRRRLRRTPSGPLVRESGSLP